MAAHLKKRALAEYALTTTEGGPRPSKQVQLTLTRTTTSKPRTADQPQPPTPASHTCDWSPVCLADASNTSAILAGLLALHYAIPLPEDLEKETIESLIALLTSLSCEEVNQEGGNKPEATRQDLLAQILPALSSVISSPDNQLVGSVVEAICKSGNQWLQKEQQRQLQLSQHQPSSPNESDNALSCRVIAAAVRAACTLCTATSLSNNTNTSITASQLQQVLKLALSCLSVYQHHLVKVSCLDAAGAMCAAVDHLRNASHCSKRDRRPHSPMTAEVVLLLIRHATHHDNRVRTASYKAMVSCERGGVRLPPEAYSLVCAALNDDDYQCVREAAIDLIKNIAINDGERLIPASGADEEPERLADHAFFRICGCMNDVAVRVRVNAALALSSIPEVSHHVLLQTLDKKLFSNMRRKLSYHERQAALVSSGQWSRGREWGEDTVKEKVSAESTSLTHSAGAFVHGLEDECLEVRSASLDALAILAEGSSLFATQCLDFLVDMFNDEIEDVRLKAVQVLQRIVRHIRLQEDQLDEILHALKDSWQCIRESVHTLIGTCTFTTIACLQATVAALMDNIRRYPQDVPSIQQCMVLVGCRQADLVAGLVPQLLLTHPYFDAVQPSLHQSNYICKLLLVLNAAAKMPTIIPLLEEHTMKHYAYLRDTLPNLVPQLKVSKPITVSTGELQSNTEDFLQQSLSKLCRLDRASTTLRLTLYSSVHSDLQKLAALDPTMSAAAEFAALHTRCSLILARLLNCSGWLQQESSGSNVQQLVSLTFRLVHAFTGLGETEKACARGMRLRALALQLVFVVNGSTGSALGLCEAFLNHARPLREANDALPSTSDRGPSMSNIKEDGSNVVLRDEFLAATLNALKDERRPGTVARTLQPLLSAHPPTPLSPIVNPRDIRQASAKINEPTQDSDAIHKLTAGLLLAMPLDAQLYHIPDPRSVRIRIAYPDQSVQHVVPRASHLQPTEQPHCYRLNTTVLLTAGIWSEACKVQISLVLDLSPAGPKRKHDPHTIDLSDEPTTLMLWPKPMKKGIM